jgi:4-diphosphocytidyl-2-C-methyl-D-erythritol kinase
MARPVKRSDSSSHRPIVSSPDKPTTPLSLRAPAKINWFLHIVQKRKDGYHDIVSLMQCVSLFDELFFDHADSIVVEGDMDIPVSENLIFKAASFLKKYASYPKGARILVEKRIPLGAGLGGGSSNAAYTLTGLNTLWKLGLSHGKLCSISAELGSDVPFFFHGPAAVVEGKGDRVNSLKIGRSHYLLLVKPGVDVSTAWAYAAFDRVSGRTLTKKPIDIKLFCQALEKQDFLSLDRILFNDFEDVIVREYPVVREIQHKLREMGAEVAAMSGSGPTVFGVFRGRKEAEEALVAMTPNWCSIAQTLI